MSGRWRRRRRQAPKAERRDETEIVSVATNGDRPRIPILERRQRELMEAVRRHEERQERRRQRMRRVAATSAAGVAIASVVAAGASGIFASASRLPWVTQSPHLRPEAGRPTEADEPTKVRGLRGYAASIGPMMRLRPGEMDGPSALVVSFASREGDPCLILVTDPEGASLDADDAVRNGEWTCMPGLDFKRALRARPVELMLRRLYHPVMIGFARADVVRVSGWGPTGAFLGKVTRSWDPEIAGLPVLRVWATYPARTVDHLGGSPADRLPTRSFAVRAILRDGSTEIVRLP